MKFPVINMKFIKRYEAAPLRVFTTVPFLLRTFLITGCICLLSCDKIEGPYGEKVKVNVDTGTVKRKVLLEDFTGHTCGNCPEAAAITEQLHSLYGEQIVPVCIHVGFFADPAGSKYSANYKTTAGTDLAAFYGIGDVLPKGMVNRKDFDGKKVLDHQDWPSKVAPLVNQQADLSVAISPTYTAASRIMEVTLDFKLLHDVPEQLYYLLYLLEDSLQSPQKNYALPEGEVLNYYHRYVLRTSLNGSWGATISNGNNLSAGQTFKTEHTYTLPAQWNEKRMSLVAIVYRASDREVIQVENAKVWAP